MVKFKNSLNCSLLDSWVFGYFMLADQLYAEAFWSLETCLSVNNNLCGKLVSSLESPITLNERFKVTSVLFYSWLWFAELWIRHFYVYNESCYNESFFIDIILKQNKFAILLQFLVKDPK